MKKAVRRRDGYRCTKCGLSNAAHVAKHGRTLHVHRVVPGSEYTLDGCVTLCVACHGPEPRRPARTYPSGRANVGVPEPWHAVMRKLAAKKKQPVLWYLIELAAERAKSEGIATPTPPWEEDS